MGGKTGTTTQSVSIPPEVLARYNSVNAQAQQVAATPFQPYTGQFVAGITPTQQAGIAATSQYAQAAQPYYQAATGQLGAAQGQGQQALQQAFGTLGQGMDVGQQYAQAATGGIGGALQYAQPYQQAATGAALAGAEQLTPENINIQGYMSPYTQAVADTTYQALRQQQQQEMAGQTANAIRAGAFGGDRAGLVAANLARQQQLGMAQAMAPIYQQGYQQALGTAMTAAQSNRAALQNLAQQLQGIGQQGYGQQMGAAQQLAGLGQQQFGQGLGAAQQLGALGQAQYGMGAGTAQQLAALGTGAQQAALQGAQAQLGAGTLEQQTQQADLTARYQQFLQERGYPFQVAQFLANIAMGTGALSGSTTTTTQPMPFFSDRRVKHDVKEIGKTHDGQPIYSFKYNGEKATRIGLMAQDVEKKHPEAVYDMDGIKGVDYEEATKDSARPERYSGGLVPASMGGAVTEPGAYNRGGYLAGGLVDPNDIQSLLAAQQEGFGPFSEGGIYGGSQHQAPYMTAKGIVPQSRLHTPKLMQPGAAPRPIDSGVQQALSAFDTAVGMKDRYDTAKRAAQSLFGSTPQETEDRTRIGQTGTDRKNLAGPDIVPDKTAEEEKNVFESFADIFRADGGVVPRSRYAIGGASKDPSLPYDEDDKSPYKYFPTEILDTEKAELPKPGQPPQQSGSGLGTALSVAKFALGFFNEGGAVPRNRYQVGGEAEPYELAAAKEILRQREGFLEKPKYDVNALRAGYGTDEFTTPEGKVVPVTAETRFTREDAERDLARRATNFMQKAQSDIGSEAWSKLTPDARAALTSVTYNYGSVPKSVIQAAQSGDTAAVADAVYGLRGHNEGINAGRRAFEARFINPQGEYQADLPATKAATASGVMPTGSTGEGGGLFPSANRFLAENQAWLSPLGAGLKGMFQSRSPFLGAAIGEGIGAGLEAVGPSQEQLAGIGLTKAQQTQALSNIDINKLIGQIDPATGQIVYRLRSDMFGGTLADEGLKQQQQKTIEAAEQAVGGEKPTTEAPPAEPAKANEPIVSTVEGGKYNYTVQPTSISDRKFATLGFTGSPNDKYRIQANIGQSPKLMEQQDTENEILKSRKAMAANAAMMRQDLIMLSDAVLGISKEGLTSVGPGQASRARLVNLYNWAVDNAGLDGNKINVGDDIKNAQIIEKLRSSAGIGKAGPAGFHAASIAQAINDAQPSGELDEEASRKLIASMFVQNQLPEDYSKYGDEYALKYGGLLFADSSFKEEVGQRYEAEKKALTDALIPVQMPDGTYKSRLQWLRENPARAAEFENHYKLPGIARLALGG